MKRIRIAQIGTSKNSHGNQVWNSMVKQSEIFDVVGYAFPENEREKFPDYARSFDGYREMKVEDILNDPQIEAVTVETEEIYLTKYLLYKLKEHFLRLLINLAEIGFQITVHPHHVDDGGLVFFQVLIVPLPPDTDLSDPTVLHFDTSITLIFFVGASIILSRSLFTTSTHPSSSMTCLRYSLIPLTSTRHSKSSSTMCLLGCFTYFTAFTPPFIYIVAQRGGKDECADSFCKQKSTGTTFL